MSPKQMIHMKYTSYFLWKIIKKKNSILSVTILLRHHDKPICTFNTMKGSNISFYGMTKGTEIKRYLIVYENIDLQWQMSICRFITLYISQIKNINFITYIWNALDPNQAVYICILIWISVFLQHIWPIFASSSWKHAYIILTPLNPTFI